MKAVDLRPGTAVNMDGRLLVVVKYEHRTPGNLRAFIQVKLKDVQTGQHIEKRLGSSDEIDAVDLDRRTAEYLYEDTEGYVFMDSETFDQFALDRDFASDAMQYLRPNGTTEILFYEDKPIVIELPPQVELEVTETPPGIKGATATNQLKEAILETGLKTKVPPFIDNGEMIRISTADGSYISRVKGD